MLPESVSIHSMIYFKELSIALFKKKKKKKNWHSYDESRFNWKFNTIGIFLKVYYIVPLLHF